MCQRLRRHEFERARRTSFATPTFAPHFSSAASAQLACEPKLRRCQPARFVQADVTPCIRGSLDSYVSGDALHVVGATQ